ncbi:restriction endonuclease [Ammonicoccus fulvus]|uniref:Restriction endonuclease n=1 Tax=Ammonicoccus fulvus TaxID=3138240 RepID=A0ABZ3FQM2_9ACTN
MASTGESQVPPWSRLTIWCLRALSDGATKARRVIRSEAAALANLPAGAAEETLASGGTRLNQRLDWAITHLARAQLIEQTARAQYRISNKGRQWYQNHPDGMSYSEANSYFGPYWPKTADVGPDPEPSVRESGVEDPDERMDTAQATNRESVGTELLDLLRASDPAFFERSVVDLLLKMGYGGAEKRGTAIGKSGDGGVDGVIDEDVLGLDRIYIQAKRHAEGNNIAADRIQAFVGALHGRGATKGVFITTSRFTPAAIQYATSVPTQVRLIDGDRLVALMMKYLVGVETKNTYTTVGIDMDYFEQ